MEILQGKTPLFWDTVMLRKRVAGYPTVHIDIGTGDGFLVHHLAARNPHTFMIGLDACRENLHAVSGRGAAENTLFVIANALMLPPELTSSATQVTLNFPWSSLAQGLLEGDPGLLRGLCRVMQPGAALEIRLNAEAVASAGWALEAGAAQIQTLLHSEGFRMHSPHVLSPADLRRYPTRWAKRLAYGRDPRALLLAGQWRG
jgi:trans-aconitate methyltransferase